ncbi:hypothetical protein BDZ45DRAFT_766733 [Acephala macrosclerotiorum]|nr:hypothetical protein BDZ45DRAFT_766733 [Acephala macrosclerotiorum]
MPSNPGITIALAAANDDTKTYQRRPRGNPKVLEKHASSKYLKFTSPSVLVDFLVTDPNFNEIQKFTVHKEHVCMYSPVLRAALSNDFAAGQTDEYRLTGTTARAVCLLVTWFYFQNIRPKQLNADPNANLEVDPNAVTKKQKEDEDASLAELWVLADTLHIPRLQNKLVDRMREIAVKHCMAPSGTIFKYAYDNLLPRGNRGLVQVLVLLTVAYLPRTTIWRIKDNYPREMLLDVLTYVAESDHIRFSQALDDIETLCYVDVPEEDY